MDALKGAPSSRMFLQQTQTLPPNRSALRESRHLIKALVDFACAMVWIS